MPNHPQGPVTADRDVRFRLDVADYQAIQLPYANIMLPSEIAKGPESLLANCEVTKVGIQLAPMDVSAISETTDGNGLTLRSIADGGTLQVAPGIKSFTNWRKPTELTGADTGAWSGVSSQGDYFLEKTVPATTDWTACNLSADLAAWPDPVSPHFWGDPSKIFDGSLFEHDRIIVGTDTSDGHAPLMFRFSFDGNVQSTPDYVLIFHFAGPRGSSKTYTGTGNYALALTGDGNARLYERGLTTGATEYDWVDMGFQFRYAAQSQVGGRQHRISIIPYVFAAPLNGIGGSIYFKVTTGDGASTKSGTASTHMFHNQSDPSAQMYHVKVYNPPDTPTPQIKPQAAIPCPVRVSQRRDIRPQIQISLITFNLNGFVVTDPFQFLVTPVTAPELIRKIEIVVTGSLPEFSEIMIDLFDAQQGTADPKDPTSTGLSQIAGGGLPNGAGVFATFWPVAGSWTYQVRVWLDGVITPTLTSISVNMNGSYTEATPGEFIVNTYPTMVTEYNFSGADADPTHETGTIVVSDLPMQFPRLKNRGRFRTRIDTTYTANDIDWNDSSNDWKRPVLFDGYVISNPGERRGSDRPNGIATHDGHVHPSDLAQFPNHQWRQYHLSLVGCWKRISEGLAPFGWNFAIDPEAGNGDGLPIPYKATDAMLLALSWGGLPDECIDIGAGTSSDFDIRLFVQQNTDAVTLTPGQDILEWCQSIARDYLGMALIFDANATRSGPSIADKSKIRGCWRLAHPAVAPFNVLADFVTEPGSGMLGNLVHMLSAYPHRTSDNGTVIQTVPIWKGSITYSVKPPECNHVIVSGSGEMNINKSGNEMPELLTAWMPNPISFDYLGVPTSDPESPDYIGTMVPAYKVDMMQIQDSNSAKFICKRWADLATHGIDMVTFTAPLVLVWDKSDTKQVRPRPLRFQDAVTLDGDIWIVRDCNIHFKKDYLQYGTYTLQKVTHPFLNPTGAL